MGLELLSKISFYILTAEFHKSGFTCFQQTVYTVYTVYSRSIDSDKYWPVVLF